MTVEHDRWSVEREYPHPPPRVFAAWARPELKLRWFDLSDTGPDGWEIDFRPGGHERFRTAAGVAPTVEYDCEYHDIVEDVRIVGTYRIVIDGRCTVVAVSVVEFAATADGTRLRCTQQAAALDGLALATDQRDGLTRQLARLADVLAGSA